MTERKKSHQEEYAEKIAKELIERLKQGTAPFQLPWQPDMGRDFPFNPVSGTEYSGMNRLNLMIQGYSDPRWMTYKQAQSVNVQVRKGERGTGLVRLITHTEKIQKDEKGKIIRDENGEPVKERIQLENPYFKSFTVFNAEQIDGLPAWEKAPPVWIDHDRAEKLLKASGAVIHHRGNDAYYNRTRDFIVLPPKERFFGQGEYYAVALHELGHWTGHADRLNRDMGGRFGDSSYAREELRAEISSMMMSRELGLPHNPDRHAGYVGDWVKVLTEEPMEILKASQDAAKIKEFIFSFEKQIEIDREQNQSIDQATNTTRPSENEKFVEPGNQTLEERVQAAKERYEDRFSEISANDQKKYRHLEEGMEKLIKGLPEHTQAQVRFHFYQSQYEHMSVKNELEQSPAQQEMFYGR